MKTEEGKIDGYKWKVVSKKTFLGGYQTSYMIESPDGIIIDEGSSFQSLDNAVTKCKNKIEIEKLR